MKQTHTVLTRTTMQVHHEKVKQQSPTNGGSVEVDQWTFVFLDKDTGDTIAWSCGKDVRDAIVRQLTGGIVLAGGELPRV